MARADLPLLFATEGPRLLRRLRAFRGRIIAEDVVQTAFARMLEVDDAEIDDPRAYLIKLTRNLAIDEVRRQKRTPVSFVSGDALEASASSERTPEEVLIEGERFDHMRAFVQALPEKERLSLLMFKLEGLSHAQIGVRLGVSRHSVPRYLSRALAKCAEAMQAFERAELGENNDDKRKGATDRT